MKYILYRIVRTLGYPIFLLLYRPEFEGRNNIPKSGSVILAGNHTNNLDAAIMIAGPKRVVHMLAKKELFKSKISNAFFRSMGCIPVDRKIHDENAKSEAIKVLKNNEVIGIFPEGTVNRTNDIILPFKYGAVSFAKKTGAYIVPFTITGKYKLFRRNIKITYGKPYKVTDDLEIENKKLMNIITKMLIKERSNVKRKR
ncbi:MAG: 1-acyl-sn-glycerol-3-phosphate acyltransferase [Clostridium sp.]|nr:1-acyl-sn-glycerol-3-phosphate acyltransferase [Clostridium sp.]